MNQQSFNEHDWKLFKQKIPKWQEAYMNRLNEEYIQLLSENEAPSHKFWKLERRIKKDKNRAGVQVELSRSMMFLNLIKLIKEEAITLADLDGFSDGLRGRLEVFFKYKEEEFCNPDE